jgi:hypothetical protein
MVAWAPMGAPFLAVEADQGEELTWDRYLAAMSVRLHRMEQENPGAVEAWMRVWEDQTGEALPWTPNSLDQLPETPEFQAMLTANGVDRDQFPKTVETESEGARGALTEAGTPWAFVSLNNPKTYR